MTTCYSNEKVSMLKLEKYLFMSYSFIILTNTTEWQKKAIFHVFFLKFEKKIRTFNIKQYSSKNGKELFDPSIPSPPQNKTNKIQ